MSGDDGTYAPKSPDLSSFFSSSASAQTESWATLPRGQIQTFQPAHPQQQPQQQPQQLHPQPQYHSPSAHAGANSQPQPHNPLGAGYPHPPQSPFSQLQQPHQQQQDYSPPAQLARHSQSQLAYGLQAPPAQQQYYQPYGDLPYQQHPLSAPQTQLYPQPQYHPAAAAFQSASQPEAHLQSPSETMPPRRSATQAAQPPAVAPSPVRTKFPTARIKRIMQADEEVGKVAQQTPIAVGKALELFMVALVTKSADVAKEKNSKRVTAQMLKYVVESDDQWDFLRDIVSRVENEEKAAKSGGRVKAESDSDEDAVDKKKGKGGRKKKV